MSKITLKNHKKKNQIEIVTVGNYFYLFIEEFHRNLVG
jgi:hypothetical protein